MLLRKSLRKVGLDPDACTYMNVVSCWPRLDTTPQPAHIAACRDNLRDQLRVVEDKYVLVCGRTAAQALLPHSTLKHSTGMLVPVHGKKVFVVRHPASFISGRSKRADFEQWLVQLGDFRTQMTFGEMGTFVTTHCLYCEKKPYPSPYSLTCRGHGVTLQADSQWESSKWWKTNSKNKRKSKETEDKLL